MISLYDYKKKPVTIFRSPGSWNNEVSHAVTIRLFLVELTFKDKIYTLPDFLNTIVKL